MIYPSENPESNRWSFLHFAVWLNSIWSKGKKSSAAFDIFNSLLDVPPWESTLRLSPLPSVVNVSSFHHHRNPHWTANKYIRWIERFDAASHERTAPWWTNDATRADDWTRRRHHRSNAVRPHHRTTREKHGNWSNTKEIPTRSFAAVSFRLSPYLRERSWFVRGLMMKLAPGWTSGPFRTSWRRNSILVRLTTSG